VRIVKNECDLCGFKGKILTIMKPKIAKKHRVNVEKVKLSVNFRLKNLWKHWLENIILNKDTTYSLFDCQGYTSPCIQTGCK
jgi:hypothetical protein